MKITKEALRKINLAVSEESAETGGILGSADGGTITEVITDTKREPVDRFCCYKPDVKFFNECIEKWLEAGIKFKGIFHTHFSGEGALSKGDEKYISAITDSMPEGIDYLYFPVFVVSERKLVGHKAEKIDGKIDIFPEKIITV